MTVRKRFGGTLGRHSTRPRGDDGTLAAKERIASLRHPGPGTFSITPAAAASDRKLGRASPLHVLVLLGKFRNSKTGQCYPAIGRIAKLLGITPRSVQRHLNKLIKQGFVTATGKVGPNGGWATNDYTLLYPPLPRPEKSPCDAVNEKNGAEPTSATVPSSEALMTAERDATLDVASLPSSVEAMRHPVSQGLPFNVASPSDTEGRINDPVLNDPRLIGISPDAGDLPTTQSGSLRRPIPDVPSEKPLARQRSVQSKPRNMQNAMPRDPIGEVLQWAAKKAGGQPAILWAFALRWHEDLTAAGFSDSEAQAIIVEVGRSVQFGGIADDPIRLIGERICALIEVRRGGAAAA